MKFFKRLFRFADASKKIDLRSEFGRLHDGAAELKIAVQKLGRTQFRANAVAESGRKEIRQMVQQTAALLVEPQKETLEELLLAVDGLEEGLRAAAQLTGEHGLTPAWTDGFRIVHERLIHILKRWHVTPMETVGQQFTPDLHRAVDAVQTDEAPENTIVEEQRRGYLCGEEVLRYAEVVVAKKKEYTTI